ncbi:ATPase [Mycobacterium heidelbergense]|nr:ATPase [Mycobacterium heidelbergense]
MGATPPPPGQTGPTQRFTMLGQAPPAQPTRDRRTRRTVDLPLATHRALDVWQREAADRIGVARVTGQEVLTALIDQLLVDPKLSSQITRAIQARR